MGRHGCLWLGILVDFLLLACSDTVNMSAMLPASMWTCGLPSACTQWCCQHVDRPCCRRACGLSITGVRHAICMWSDFVTSLLATVQVYGSGPNGASGECDACKFPGYAQFLGMGSTVESIDAKCCGKCVKSFWNTQCWAVLFINLKIVSKYPCYCKQSTWAPASNGWGMVHLYWIAYFVDVS